MTDRSDAPAPLRNRIMTAMISNAFFSWQSALIIAISIIFFAFSITPFGWWQPFFWLLFWLLSVGIFIGATVTDPGAQQRVIERLLREKYTPEDIKNPAARERMNRALEYYSAIQNLATTRTGASRVEYENTIDELDVWVAQLYELGKRVDQFDENQIINRDRMQARREMDDLQRRLKAEPDERVKDEIKHSIEMKETQLENLKNLEANIKRADIQMDNTLSALGTIYAQMQVIGSKSIDQGSAQRLRNQVHDQVMDLQDTIAAIDEVHQHRAY
ncbi:MAG TPA: hypothetical protein VJZ27_08055 [Aggregatilineales bacterium]|nr:hypothetical protein [Aggregatilineales bacterium]